MTRDVQVQVSGYAPLRVETNDIQVQGTSRTAEAAITIITAGNAEQLVAMLQPGTFVRFNAELYPLAGWITNVQIECPVGECYTNSSGEIAMRPGRIRIHLAVWLAR